MVPCLATYEEFWPFCVSQHRHAVNRGLHFVGTTLGIQLYPLAA